MIPAKKMSQLARSKLSKKLYDYIEDFTAEIKRSAEMGNFECGEGSFPICVPFLGESLSDELNQAEGIASFLDYIFKSEGYKTDFEVEESAVIDGQLRISMGYFIEWPMEIEVQCYDQTM